MKLASYLRKNMEEKTKVLSGIRKLFVPLPRNGFQSFFEKQ